MNNNSHDDNLPQAICGPDDFWWIQRMLCSRRKNHPQAAPTVWELDDDDIEAIANNEFDYEVWASDEERNKAEGGEYTDEYIQYLAEKKKPVP